MALAVSAAAHTAESNGWRKSAGDVSASSLNYTGAKSRLSWRSIVAAATAGCLIVNLLSAILLSVGMRAGTSWVPICTAEGLKWKALDADGKPASDKLPPDRPCPFCLAGTPGVPFLLPTAPRLLFPVLAVVSLLRVWPDFAPTLCLAARPPPSRAPPAPSH